MIGSKIILLLIFKSGRFRDEIIRNFEIDLRLTRELANCLTEWFCQKWVIPFRKENKFGMELKGTRKSISGTCQDSNLPMWIL